MIAYGQNANSVIALSKTEVVSWAQRNNRSKLIGREHNLPGHSRNFTQTGGSVIQDLGSFCWLRLLSWVWTQSYSVCIVCGQGVLMQLLMQEYWIECLRDIATEGLSQPRMATGGARNNGKSHLGKTENYSNSLRVSGLIIGLFMSMLSITPFRKSILRREFYY